MEPSRPYRPRVSRETRQLLIAGVLAIAALWLLARFRFRDLPVTPNPIPAVISQLTNGPKFEDLAAEVAQLQARLEPSLLAVDSPSAALKLSGLRPGWRRCDFATTCAITWLPAGSSGDHPDLLASDPASGLAILRVVGQAASSPPVPWTPRRLQQPRYLIASDVSAKGVSLRPAFVGSLDPIDSPLWPEPLWAVPARSDLAPGSFVFTSNAELVGLVISYGVERCHRAGRQRFSRKPIVCSTGRRLPPGPIGIEVQALTDAVASVTGAAVGVVVTWVDRTAPRRGT